MTSTQGSIAFDWTNTVHSREKSSYGQAHLDKNRKKFGGQNKRVFESLMAGEYLDDDIVTGWTPKIRHLHSRISDLCNEMNVLIDRKPHPTKNLTVYFMTEEQKSFNKSLIQKLTD